MKKLHAIIFFCQKNHFIAAKFAYVANAKENIGLCNHKLVNTDLPHIILELVLQLSSVTNINFYALTFASICRIIVQTLRNLFFK